MSRPIELLQLSDTHYTGTAGELYGRDPAATLDAVLTDVARRGLVPDVVVVTGDLVHSGTPEGYRRLRDRLASVGAPVYCLEGNHDFHEPLAVHLAVPGVHVERLVRLGEWLMVFVDTNARARVPSPSGYLTDAPNRFLEAVVGEVSAVDLVWLDRVLELTDAPHVMMWMHHPPLAPGGHEGLVRAELSDALFEVAERHQRVRGMAAGHVHTAWECARSGVRVFACPSTWLAMDFDSMTTASPGYRWYRFHPSGEIESTAYCTDDERFAERTALAPWAVALIAGDVDLDELEHISQEEIIAAHAEATQR